MSPVKTRSLCLLKKSLISSRGLVWKKKKKVQACPRAPFLHFHKRVSDGCVGAEWQGPVWVVNHSDSALGRRSRMAPVDEWPLTLSVRTEASLNNSMTKPKGREVDKIKKEKKKKNGLGSSLPSLIQLWSHISVSISDTNAILMSPLIMPA